MKILQVHNYYQIPGGEDTVVANERKLLKEHGHEVFLYSRDNKELKELSLVRKFFLPITVIFNPRTYFEIKKTIQNNSIDIVHVHNTLHLISPAVYYAALRCGVPVVQTIHNFRLLCPGAVFFRNGHICEDCVKYGLYCAVKYKCYRGSRIQTMMCVLSTWLHRALGIYKKLNYICLTNFNRDKLLMLKQVECEKVFVKPNFIVSSYEVKRSVSENDKPFVFAGRLDELKGIKILLKAWKYMGEKAPRLVVCGTGPLEKWCKQYIKDNKLKSVELKGFVPNEEVKKLIAVSRALILPTQWYEGFPVTIAEAFGAGTPVIGSAMGNVGCLIEEGVSGWKFDNSSIYSLIEAVVKCINNACELDEAIGNRYSAENNYKLLYDIYQKIL